jgi:hypothetical protein
MNNLIPTPRTDKTGRTVIRHMKPETATRAKVNQKLPPVTLAMSHDHAALISKATQRLNEILGFSHEDNQAELHTALGVYPNATLHRVQHHDWTHTEAADFHAIITDGEWNGTTKAFVKWDETKVNDYLDVSQMIRELSREGVDSFHHNAWDLYPELSPADTNEHAEERISQLVALYLVTEHMSEQGSNVFTSHPERGEVIYLEPSPLRDFIFNPGPNYTSSEVTRIMITHKEYDPDRIKAMLELDNPSLSGGVL